MARKLIEEEMPNQFFVSNKTIVFIVPPEGGELNQQGSLTVRKFQIETHDDKKKLAAYYVDDYVLKNANVVEKDWQEAERSEYQDLSAKVSYENGISIVADFEKLIFSDAQPEKFKDKKDFETRAKALFELLHQNGLKCHSLGINYTLILPSAKADDYFYRQFLNEKTFSSLNDKISLPQVKVSYDVGGGVTLNIKLYTADKGRMKGVVFDEKKCVVLEANFHQEIQTRDDVFDAIGSTQKKFELLRKLVQLRE